jgi:hypothetical protein
MPLAALPAPLYRGALATGSLAIMLRHIGPEWHSVIVGVWALGAVVEFVLLLRQDERAHALHRRAVAATPKQPPAVAPPDPPEGRAPL